MMVVPERAQSAPSEPFLLQMVTVFHLISVAGSARIFPAE